MHVKCMEGKASTLRPLVTGPKQADLLLFQGLDWSHLGFFEAILAYFSKSSCLRGNIKMAFSLFCSK